MSVNIIPKQILFYLSTQCVIKCKKTNRNIRLVKIMIFLLIFPMLSHLMLLQNDRQQRIQLIDDYHRCLMVEILPGNERNVLRLNRLKRD
jgi:hypothetical protein